MEIIAALCIIAAGILWGTMGIFVRVFRAWGFSTIQITALRILLAAVFFVVFLAVTNPGKLKIKCRDIPLFAGLGVGSIFLMSVTYFSTMQRTSLGAAAILLYTAPVFVMLMSVLFLKEKLTMRKLAALGTAFLGCILVTGIGGDMQMDVSGIMTGLLSGLSYALYSILGSFALRRYHPYTVSAYAFITAAAAELCICHPVQMVQMAMNSDNTWQIWGLAAVMALCTAFAPYLLYTMGLRRVEAGKAAIMATVEPMVATILGVAVFDEELTVWIIIGIVMILLAVAILNRFGRKALHT